MKNFNSYISSKDIGWEEKAVSQISNNGVVVIRDLVDIKDINKINKRNVCEKSDLKKFIKLEIKIGPKY